MSELDPLPGVVGLTNVVSIRVQLSPLRPQAPGYTSTISIFVELRSIVVTVIPVWRYLVSRSRL